MAQAIRNGVSDAWHRDTDTDTDAGEGMGGDRSRLASGDVMGADRLGAQETVAGMKANGLLTGP